MTENITITVTIDAARIARIRVAAEALGISVERAVEMLVTMGLFGHIDGNMEYLERMADDVLEGGK